MTFEECVFACLRNRELVENFDRLRGTNVARKGSPLDLEIDRQTGRERADLMLFFEFVWDCVWLRVPTEVSK